MLSEELLVINERDLWNRPLLGTVWKAISIVYSKWVMNIQFGKLKPAITLGGGALPRFGNVPLHKAWNQNVPFAKIEIILTCVVKGSRNLKVWSEVIFGGSLWIQRLSKKKKKKKKKKIYIYIVYIYILGSKTKFAMQNFTISLVAQHNCPIIVLVNIKETRNAIQNRTTRTSSPVSPIYPVYPNSWIFRLSDGQWNRIWNTG